MSSLVDNFKIIIGINIIARLDGVQFGNRKEAVAVSCWKRSSLQQQWQ